MDATLCMYQQQSWIYFFYFFLIYLINTQQKTAETTVTYNLNFYIQNTF